MKEFEKAYALVGEAGKKIKNAWQTGGYCVFYKGNINPVTEIDKEIELFMTENLKTEFPEYDIIAEEGHDYDVHSANRWILDPIDGTTNFIKKYPFAAISLALEKDAELVLGIVYNPVLNELFYAEKGGGSYLNGKKIAVSRERELSNALLASGFPYDAWENPDNNSKEWSKMICKTRSLRCDGSAALDLCRVASGQLDGYWEKGISPWDIAAGIVIAREAGALVSDYTNGNNMFERSEVIAANHEIHQKMLKILN